MHPSALNFGRFFFETYCQNSSGKTVIDLGSQDVNGSLREACPQGLKYVGVDFVEGKNVDVILQDPYKLPFENDSVDFIVCSSVFEHSEFFWLLFLEVVRILKPGGFVYLNVPSNGHFHQYPIDSWRFYPDSGRALVSWAKHNKHEVTLVESFIGKRTDNYPWNDFVGIFCKAAPENIRDLPKLITDKTSDFYNGYSFRRGEIANFSMLSEDSLLIENHKKKNLRNRLKSVRKKLYQLFKAKN